MKKKILIINLLLIGLLVYVNWFYGVKFVGDHDIGGVIKTKDEKLSAYVFCHIRNGCFTEKKVTFEIFPDKNHEISVLEEGQYAVVEIYIESGKGKISSDKKTITIPPGEEVGLRIEGEGTYAKDNYEGEVLIIRREAPETKIIIIE